MSASRVPRFLAAAALVLGALAPFGSPRSGAEVTIDTARLARIVEDEVDHVTAPDLADAILRGRPDVRVLDLRSPEDYAAYHIPTAENVPIGRLDRYPLDRTETIVLYSGGGLHSAQAWFLLQARGFRGAVILLGGLDQWTREVLFPILPETAGAEEIAAFERIRHVSEMLGGTPRIGDEAVTEVAAIEMPEVQAPPPVPVAGRRRTGKEGC